MTPLREALPDLPTGKSVLFSTIAMAAEPPPNMTVSEWADANRIVSPESGSPYPGKWSTDLVPYLREIMDCCSFTHPSKEIVLKKSNQVGGTEVGLNLLGYCIDQHPSPVMIALPTIDETSKYEKEKLEPTIRGTPHLDKKVVSEKNRSRKNSTVRFKRFKGGFLQLTGANSSSGLQMISVRVLIAEEISEWPDDAGNRGDPLSQAEKRQTAWELAQPKRYYGSTPKIKANCRITAKYEASDQRQFYVPCPQCGVFQILKWENMKRRQDHPPYGTYMECATNGCMIEHHDKRDMVSKGIYLKTYEGGDDEPGPTVEAEHMELYRQRSSRGRQPGFHIWQAYSNLVDWEYVMRNYMEADGNQALMKTFTQQTLGEAWEEEGEAPDWEKLYLYRQDYPLGKVPEGGLVLTGMADVQINRIEWAVYAWGIGSTGWLVDKGVLEGDPSQVEIWHAFEAIPQKTYQMPDGQMRTIEAFGIDCGYLSNMVYMFARKFERVFALDGMEGHQRPMIGTPTKVDVSWQGRRLGTTLKWPTGTWALKSWVYGALRKTIEGPDEDGNWPLGCLLAPDACDKEHYKQLTAEYLEPVTKRDRTVLVWKQSRSQANEQLDIVVGARALAYHLGIDRLSAEQWRRIAAERGASEERIDTDLAKFWAPGEKLAEEKKEDKIDFAAQMRRLNQ